MQKGEERRGAYQQDYSLQHIDKTSTVDAEKRLVRRRKYQFFEWDNPDDLIQADLTRFNRVPLFTMEDDTKEKAGFARIDWKLWPETNFN